MKIISFLLFTLLFSLNLVANNVTLMQLQQEKELLSSKNKELKKRNVELKALRKKLKKQRKGWGIAAAIAGTTALVATGFAIKNHLDKKEIDNKINNKVQNIKKELSLDEKELAEKTSEEEKPAEENKSFSGAGYKGFKITKKTVKIRVPSKGWQENYDLWINGPLFDNDGMTVGGYIERGIQIKSWVDPSSMTGNFNWENGIIGQKTNGDFFICKYKDKPKIATGIKWAFQNGMILRIDGKNNIKSGSKKYARSALGWNSNNEIVVVFTTKPIPAKDFPPLLASIGVDNAIYLDGANIGYEDKNGNSWGTIETAWPKADRIVFTRYGM